MQYTFLKCNARTQKTCQSSQWHIKFNCMHFNVLSTPIPFGIRNGIKWTPNSQCFKSYSFRLAFFPCLVEATVVAISSHLLLGFPWLWGFMLGFILAAVSPAVVVPCLLSLQERGFGVEKVFICTLWPCTVTVYDRVAQFC